MNNYYIYFHINPLKNEIFYVGKGKGKRAFQKTGRSNYWNKYVKKYGYIIDISEENLTEQEAFDREIFYINKIGRKDLGLGSLINLTNGGDGASGCIPSMETKNKMSLAQKGKPKKQSKRRFPMSIEQREKISFLNKGKKRTPEFCQFLSEIKKGVGIGTKRGNYNTGGDNHKSVKCSYNNITYDCLKDLWIDVFNNMKYPTFKDYVRKDKIEGLIRLNKNNNTL